MRLARMACILLMGVEILVQSFRDSFRGSDINANTYEITNRPRMKQTQQSSNLDPKRQK